MLLKVGQKIKLTEEAIENYGEEYRDKKFTITHVATKYMSAVEFYARNKPQGYHPGYDEGVNAALYDFDELNFSLYRWEIEPVEIFRS